MEVELDKETLASLNTKKYQREYRQRNKVRIQELQRVWVKNNPDKNKLSQKKYTEKNSSRINSYKRAWNKANPEICAKQCADRRARKLRATVKWANQDRIQLIYTKANRLELWLEIDFHVDHIVPLKSKFVCGLHCEDNLQILPAKENQHKLNSYWPDMW